MKKYIITSGCSYSYKAWSYLNQLLEQIYKEYGNDDNFEIEFIKLGTNSASNQFICQSTCLAVKSLIENGVNPKNILVINNYTQVGRTSIKLPHEYYDNVKHIFNLPDSDNRIYENITYSSCKSLIKIQNEIFCFLDNDTNLKGDVKDWYNFHIQNNPVKKIIEEYFENYLESIIILQQFLKLNNVKNISFLMNNVFDGWYSNLKHVYNEHKEFTLPSTYGTMHISEISDYTNILWRCIDLDMFVFHTTETNKYGGIDEYMLDKYPDKKYVQSPEREDLVFGNHPNHIIYGKFTYDYMIDKLKNWVNEIHS